MRRASIAFLALLLGALLLLLQCGGDFAQVGEAQDQGVFEESAVVSRGLGDVDDAVDFESTGADLELAASLERLGDSPETLEEVFGFARELAASSGDEVLSDFVDARTAQGPQRRNLQRVMPVTGASTRISSSTHVSVERKARSGVSSGADAEAMPLAALGMPQRASRAIVDEPEEIDHSPEYLRREKEFWLMRSLPLAAAYRFPLHDKNIPQGVRRDIPTHVMVSAPLCTMRMDKAAPRDKCWTAQGSPGGGGIGAMASIRINFISFALTKGCDIAYEPSPSLGHKESVVVFNDYFNFGDGCHTVKDLTEGTGLILKDMRIPGAKSCIKELGVICRVRRVKGFMSGQHLVRTISMLRRKYYSRYHPTKDMLWYSPFASASNLRVDDSKLGWPTCEDLPLTMNVVLHVRRGDIQDGMTKRWVPDLAITQLLEHLVRAVKDFEELPSGKRPRDQCPPLPKSKPLPRPQMRFVVHFSSQGSPEAFPIGEWSRTLRVLQHSPRTRFVPHLNSSESAFVAFTHVIESDILLYGHSAFSSVPGRFYTTGVAKNYAERRVPRKRGPKEKLIDKQLEPSYDFNGFFDEGFQGRVVARACEKMRAIRESRDHSRVCV